MITEDKTYRCLSEWKRQVENRESWIAPVSLLASLILAFVTADFKDSFGVPKDSWRALFLIAGFLSVLWTIKALYQLFKTGASPSVEELIQELKKGAVVQRTAVDAMQTESISTDQKISGVEGGVNVLRTRGENDSRVYRPQR